MHHLPESIDGVPLLDITVTLTLGHGSAGRIEDDVAEQLGAWPGDDANTDQHDCESGKRRRPPTAHWPGNLNSRLRPPPPYHGAPVSPRPSRPLPRKRERGGMGGHKLATTIDRENHECGGAIEGVTSQQESREYAEQQVPAEERRPLTEDGPEPERTEQ